MSKKLKTYKVMASPVIWLELKIEATSPIDAYDKLQDGLHDEEILESSGVKIAGWFQVMGPSGWDTNGKKPKQFSPYTRKKAKPNLEAEKEHYLYSDSASSL